jgi:hypothetical protein
MMKDSNRRRRTTRIRLERQENPNKTLADAMEEKLENNKF